MREKKLYLFDHDYIKKRTETYAPPDDTIRYRSFLRLRAYGVNNLKHIDHVK